MSCFPESVRRRVGPQHIKPLFAQIMMITTYAASFKYDESPTSAVRLLESQILWPAAEDTISSTFPIITQRSRRMASTITTTMASSLPISMKACRWTSNTGGLEHNLKLDEDVPLPTFATALPPNHALIKVTYTSLNPIDFKVAELPVIGNYVLSKPSIPCLDFAGVVADTNIPDFQPGNLVHGRTNPPSFGCLAEYVVVPRDGISTIPEGVSLRDAAPAGIAALAAYQCIAPFVKSGDKVFINGGSGGTGTYGIQIAKALGCMVTTTCSATNADLCKRLGADEIIDYRKENVLEALIERHSAEPFALFVDNIFADGSLFWQSHHYLKPDGAFVTPGGMRLVQLRALVLGMILPSFLGGGSRKFVFVHCEPKPADFAQIGQWMQAKKVESVIELEYDISQAAEAFAKLKSGRVKGKVVVRVSVL